VYNRHFIIKQDDSLHRIDYGQCFENLHRKYLGFYDFLKESHLDYYDNEFQKGYALEKELIIKNLARKKRDLMNVMRKIKDLKEDSNLINFDPVVFCNRLIDHWSSHWIFKRRENYRT